MVQVRWKSCISSLPRGRSRVQQLLFILADVSKLYDFCSDARLYRGRRGTEGPQLAAAGAALAAQHRAHAARQRHARLPAAPLRQVRHTRTLK